MPAMNREPNTRPYDAMECTTSTDDLALALSSVLKAHRFACMAACSGRQTSVIAFESMHEYVLKRILASKQILCACPALNFGPKHSQLFGLLRMRFWIIGSGTIFSWLLSCRAWRGNYYLRVKVPCIVCCNREGEVEQEPQ